MLLKFNDKDVTIVREEEIKSWYENSVYEEVVG